MQIARWGNSLAVRIPRKMVTELALKEGDNVTLTSDDGRTLRLSRETDERWARTEELLDSLRFKLPPGYKFDREEIYEERMRELGW
jgi:antitoxin MazE